RPEIEPEDRRPVEAAEPAVKVRGTRLEEQPAEEGEDGIADIPVVPGHGARGDAAGEAVAHDEGIAGAEPFDEGAEILEVVAVVRIAHDDIAAAGRFDAAHERGAIALFGDIDHTGAGFARNDLAAVARAVVGDQHFPGNTRAG